MVVNEHIYFKCKSLFIMHYTSIFNQYFANYSDFIMFCTIVIHWSHTHSLFQYLLLYSCSCTHQTYFLVIAFYDFNSAPLFKGVKGDTHYHIFRHPQFFQCLASYHSSTIVLLFCITISVCDPTEESIL